MDIQYKKSFFYSKREDPKMYSTVDARVPLPDNDLS